MNIIMVARFIVFANPIRTTFVVYSTAIVIKIVLYGLWINVCYVWIKSDKYVIIFKIKDSPCYYWKDVEWLQRTHTGKHKPSYPHQPTCRVAKTLMHLP